MPTATPTTMSGLGQWTTRASAPTARGFFAGGTANGAGFFVGGQTATSNLTATNEAYDATADLWTTKRSMPTARISVAAGVVGTVLYVADGFGNAGGNLGPLNVLEAYDAISDTWTTKAAAPTQRSDAAAGVINGIFYVVGGGIQPTPSTTTYVATCEAYDPATNAWTTKASMPTARTDLAVGAINGVLYAVGGSDTNGVATNKLEAYDPTTDSWSTKAPMPTPRSGLAVGVLNGILYAVGGQNTTGVLNTVESYDPVSNAWTTKAPLLVKREYLAVTAIGTRLYAVGGYTGGSYVNTNEAFAP